MNRLQNGVSAFLSHSKRNRILFYLVPFALLSIPVLVMLFTDSLPFTDGYYSMHYVMNYDRGYVGRGLVGEILRLFAHTVTPQVQQIAILVFTCLLVLAASLCIGRALCKCAPDAERFTLALFLILVLCLMNFTTGIYYRDYKLDKLVWALTFFAVFFADNRYLRCLLVPVFSIAAMLVNPIFCFTSVPLIAIIMIDKFQKSRYSAAVGTATVLTFGTCIFLGVLAAYWQSKLGFETPDDFLDYYYAHSTITLPPEIRERFISEWLFEYFSSSPAALLKKTFDTYFVQWNNGATSILSTLFAAVPLFSIFIWFWSRVCKNESNKFRKFVFSLCPLSLLILIPALLTSWEAEKYYGNAILVHLCLLVYFISENDTAVLGVLKKIQTFLHEKPLVFPAIFCCYAAIFMVR